MDSNLLAHALRWLSLTPTNYINPAQTWHDIYYKLYFSQLRMYFVRVHCRVLSAFIKEFDDAYADEVTYNMR